MLRFLEKVQALSVLTLSFGGCYWYSRSIAKHPSQKGPKEAEALMENLGEQTTGVIPDTRGWAWTGIAIPVLSH